MLPSTLDTEGQGSSEVQEEPWIDVAKGHQNLKAPNLKAFIEVSSTSRKFREEPPALCLALAQVRLHLQPRQLSGA